MATPPLPDEVLIEAVKVRNQHPTLQAAARALGITWSAMNNRLLRAAERGLDGSVPNPIPVGQKIKGVSALYDAGGNVVMQWVKTTADQNTTLLVDAIRDTFEQYAGKAQLAEPPALVDENLATVYPIADPHLGLYAWAAETGEDYDLVTAETRLRDAMNTLVCSSPDAHTGVVLDLGDFFHSDTNENRTLRSGHALDVDTRYAKVLRVGVELMVQCVELALQKHDRVIVRCLAGNHDTHTSLALSIALSAFFRNEPRVEVDCDPSKFFVWRWGQVMLAATHGDTVRPDDMGGIMASYWPRDWGETTHRYAYFGHVHHKSKGGGERHGVVWETFQSLAAKDAWHRGAGYSSGQSMSAITLHKDHGEVFRHTVSLR